MLTKTVPAGPDDTMPVNYVIGEKISRVSRVDVVAAYIAVFLVVT